MFRGYARYSYDQVSNSLASSHGIRARHRRYAVPGRDNSRDSVSEQKMRLCRTHASKRRCFPWSRARARLRNSPRNCGHDVNSRLIDEFRRIPASRFPRSSRLKFRYGEISGLIEPAPFYLRPAFEMASRFADEVLLPRCKRDDGKLSQHGCWISVTVELSRLNAGEWKR